MAVWLMGIGSTMINKGSGLIIPASQYIFCSRIEAGYFYYFLFVLLLFDRLVSHESIGAKVYPDTDL
jgi:hypothetical protein